jgi:rod shape determining protein RodA
MNWFKGIDWWLLLPILLISTLGLLIIFRIDTDLVRSQLVFLFLGLALYFFLANFDIKILLNFSLLFYLLSLVLLVVTFIVGQVTRGSVRWIKIGFLNFQASEFVKPMLILFFANLAASSKLYKVKDLTKFFLFVILPAFLVFKQPDLGSSLVILAIWFGILLGCRVKASYLVAGAAILLLSLPLVWHFLKPYQQQRVVTFMNPNFDPLGSGYHVLQAMIGVGSGQWFGKGLGSGTQSQLRFLPENHTDFIFASFAEEFGFIGTTFLVFIYFCLLMRILLIAQKVEDKRSTLVCLGVFMLLFFQSLINIGMNLGVLPITGITLPLFSFGGNSLVASFSGLGFVQGISNLATRKAVIEIG